MEKTTAEDYYTALGELAGLLFYLNRKDGSKEEFILESVLIDSKNKELTIKTLQRVMDSPDFIAFPGTPEFSEFVNEVAKSDNNK